MRNRIRLASIGLAVAALVATTTSAHAAPSGPDKNAVAYTTVTEVNTPAKPDHTKTGVTPNYGTTVACVDHSERHSAYNALNMLMMWYQINVHWCWDRNLIITSWASSYAEDTPGLCWAYTGESAERHSYGPGYGFGDVSRGGYFRCGVGSLAMTRTLNVGMHVEGGGGYYFE